LPEEVEEEEEEEELRIITKLPNSEQSYYCYKYCYSDSRKLLSRNESGRYGALKSDSTHHFFRNADGIAEHE
jgi:hypothetical protein